VLGLMLTTLVIGSSSSAQVKRPYHNGSVWSIGFIKAKPGMESGYLEYIATEWKRIQEASKKDGLILSYKVLQTESHGPTDWNLLLLTEYKNLTTMEASEQKFDGLIQRLVGDDEKQRKGYRDRLEMREVIGERLAREIVLEPRPGI
jgi:hypothetical protein